MKWQCLKCDNLLSKDEIENFEEWEYGIYGNCSSCGCDVLLTKDDIKCAELARESSEQLTLNNIRIRQGRIYNLTTKKYDKIDLYDEWRNKWQ